MLPWRMAEKLEGPDLVGYLNRIAATYDLAPEAFLDLFAKQEHRCAVCRKGLTLFAENLAEAPAVDHDHTTGAVRGILCRGCNTAVGYIEKDRVRTRRVLGYLRKSNKMRGESWREAREAGRGWARGMRRDAKALAVLNELDASQPDG